MSSILQGRRDYLLLLLKTETEDHNLELEDFQRLIFALGFVYHSNKTLSKHLVALILLVGRSKEIRLVMNLSNCLTKRV